MSEFYACKYKTVIGSDKQGSPIFVPIGTVFVVEAIMGNMIELKAVTKIQQADNVYPVMVSVDVLEFAFTKNETI